MTYSFRRAAWLALAVAAACGPRTETPRAPVVAATGARTLSILGTNDLHGALDRLPILAGYVDNLRAARAADGGAVALIDAGDMFQGTLASNLNEGAAVIEAYNAIGYTAAAVGNHEFDFGPIGERVIATEPGDDPRGALKARAKEARFPLLTANLIDVSTDAHVTWPNMPATTMVELAGLKIGIIGVTTEATPFTTMPANFEGLRILLPATAVTAESKRLRTEGAQVIIVTAHIGSKCKDLHNPTDLSTCETNEELFKMIELLPQGLVDVIIAGHTHAGMAHRVRDIAVLESFSSGRAFGRVDLRVSASGHVTAVTIVPPTDLCPLDDQGTPVPVAACTGRTYEGQPVVPNATVAEIIARAQASADTRANERLGPTVPTLITRGYDQESALGNWFADLMLAANPGADVAMTNGGGLRADVPAGALTYGQLFTANPFDNRFALVKLEGRHVRQMITRNLGSKGGIFSWAGVAATARCTSGGLEVAITRGGKPLRDDDRLTMVTSDFLASGGDGVIGRLKLPAEATTITNVIIRDAMAALLRAQKTPVDAGKLYDARAPRLRYPGKRPVACGDVVAPSTQVEPEE